MLSHARGVLVAMMATTATLSAQVTITSDAAFNSQYQARGLTTTNHPVVQAEVLLSAPIARGAVTAGVWTNVEGGRYSNPTHHISENAGAGARPSEFNVWLEAALPFKRLTVTPGVLAYAFPNREGTTSVSNTVELYVTAAAAAPLAPTLSLWYDVHAVQGAYGEFSLSHSVGRLSLGAAAGMNWGQSVGDGGELGYYERRGLTHSEVSLGTSWTLGGVDVAPSAHVVWGSDPTTRVATPTAARGAKLWFGTTLTWSRRLGRNVNNGSGAGGESAAPQVAVK